jgi:hypothetical protein
MESNETSAEEPKPTTLFGQGAALAEFADSLDLLPYSDRRVMGGMFYEEKMVGAAIAGMLAWLESRWGPIAVRAAQKEAIYYTEDESFIGEVPSFTSDGKRLSVGDEVTGKAHRDGEVRSFKGVIKKIGPTYWGSELCPTGVVVDGPDVPQGYEWSWDWHDLEKVTES